MKHDVPFELQAGYAHSLTLSIATITSLNEFKYSDNKEALDKIITALEITYDDVKRVAGIRQKEV